MASKTLRGNTRLLQNNVPFFSKVNHLLLHLYHTVDAHAYCNLRWLSWEQDQHVEEALCVCLNTKAGPRPPQTGSERQVYVKSSWLRWTGREMETCVVMVVSVTSSFILTLSLCSCVGIDSFCSSCH